MTMFGVYLTTLFKKETIAKYESIVNTFLIGCILTDITLVLLLIVRMIKLIG